MLTWAYPDFVVVGLALAGCLLLLLNQWRRAGRLGRALGSRPRHRGWKLVLRLLTGACLLGAALGPALGVSQQPVRTAGKDVWLLVDVSRSMDAPDVAPSRLLRAQAELQTLVAQFPADRLGLVVFGAEAVVPCPLTFDQDAVQVFISTLRTSLLPAGPTTLRAPLELVLSRLTPAIPAAATRRRRPCSNTPIFIKSAFLNRATTTTAITKTTGQSATSAFWSMMPTANQITKTRPIKISQPI